MKAKALEIRDEATFIAALAVDMQPENEGQRYLLRRCGYPCDGRPNVVLTRLSADGDRSTNDPYWWNDRTWKVAHMWIIDHWDLLNDGDVVDVEFILGEKESPKLSERLSATLTGG